MKKIYLILILLLPVLLQAQTANYSESDTVYAVDAITAVRYELNDSSAQRWGDEILRIFLNQSLKEVAAQGVIVKQDTIRTSLKVFQYSLNTDCMAILGALFKGSDDLWRGLYKRSISAIMETENLFGREAELNKIYGYTELDKSIILTPMKTAYDSLIIFYAAYANDLTDSSGWGGYDSVIVNVPYEYQVAVVQGAKKRALVANREIRGE